VVSTLIGMFTHSADPAIATCTRASFCSSAARLCGFAALTMYGCCVVCSGPNELPAASVHATVAHTGTLAYVLAIAACYVGIMTITTHTDTIGQATRAY
jgi:hypothetical protein